MITCGWVGKLSPARQQTARFNQWIGGLRFVSNRVLDAEKAEYDATKKFLWLKGTQPIAVAMKRQPGLEWRADLPAHAVLDVCRQLAAALRTMVRPRKAGRDWGFPKRKKKFVNEPSIYLVGQATTFGDGWVKLPKLGRIKVSGGKLPEGKPLAARVWRDGGDRWMISAQFHGAQPDPLPASNRMVAIDLGVRRLATVFEGEAFEPVDAPRPRRRAAKRLRQAQRRQWRRRNGSARRRVAARRVAVLHRKVREARKDFLHQLSHRLTTKAGVVKVEDLNVRAIARGFLAKSAADAGLGGAARLHWRQGRVARAAH
jgi:putative transposase